MSLAIRGATNEELRGFWAKFFQYSYFELKEGSLIPGPP